MACAKKAVEDAGQVPGRFPPSSLGTRHAVKIFPFCYNMSENPAKRSEIPFLALLLIGEICKFYYLVCFVRHAFLKLSISFSAGCSNCFPHCRQDFVTPGRNEFIRFPWPKFEYFRSCRCGISSPDIFPFRREVFPGAMRKTGAGKAVVWKAVVGKALF